MRENVLDDHSVYKLSYLKKSYKNPDPITTENIQEQSHVYATRCSVYLFTHS